MMNFGRNSIDEASVHEIDITVVHSDKHAVGIFDKPLRLIKVAWLVVRSAIIIKYE
jgi:hypothetical protein